MAVRKSKKIYTGPTNLKNRRETVYVSPHLIVAFELNRRGIARIAVGQELQHATHALVVQDAMPYAIQISPRGRTLDYVSSWRASDGFAVIAGMRRAACKLENTSAHAASVEWISPRGFGSGYRVLGRTLAHLNSTSPIAVQKAARKAASKARKAWDPKLHPRAPGGRFAPARGTQAALRRRAQRAAQIRDPEQ